MFRSLKKTAFVTLTAATLVGGIGCGDAPSSGVVTTPRVPVGPTTVPSATTTATYAGVYDALMPINFTMDGVLPGQLSPILGGLSDISDNPGKSIVLFAKSAGLDLGGFGGIVQSIGNAAVQAIYKSNPGIMKIADIISGISGLTKTMDFRTTITIRTPQANGSVVVEQQIVKVGFHYNSQGIEVPVPADKLVAAKSIMVGTLTPSAKAPLVADATVSFANGTFSLPVGAMLMDDAVPALVYKDILGNSNAKTLKDALLGVIDCNAFGVSLANWVNDNISDKLDVSPGLGTTICQGGVGFAADQISNKIRSISLNGVKMERADVTLLDVPPSTPTAAADRQSDALYQGTSNWLVPVIVGSPVTVPSNFSGLRIGNAY